MICGYCAIGSENSAMAAGQGDDDRQHRREDRPIDEEVRDHGRHRHSHFSRRLRAGSGLRGLSPAARMAASFSGPADQRRHGDLLGLDLHPRADLLEAADHDPVVRLQALDHAQAVLLRAAPVVTRRYWTLLSRIDHVDDTSVPGRSRWPGR